MAVGELTQETIDQYPELWDKKTQYHREQFSLFNPQEVKIFASPNEAYRLRAEFRIWHQGDECFHIMFDPITKQKLRINHWRVGSVLMQTLMSLMMQVVHKNPILKQKLYQIDYLTTLSNQVMVSLIYHKPLDAQWQQAIQHVKQELASMGIFVNFIGRAKKQKIVIDQDFVIEALSIENKTFYFKQIENSFTQPNGEINCKMLTWSSSQLVESKGDLLELYCGNANFSIVLAKYFDQVLATEIAKPSIAAAQFNVVKNEINNLWLKQGASDVIAQQFKLQNFTTKYEVFPIFNFSTLLVDPPRAGLDPITIELAQQFDRIVYISCDPETLKENLLVLSQSHTLSALAFFDQFPYTNHIETGVVLDKK